MRTAMFFVGILGIATLNACVDSYARSGDAAAVDARARDTSISDLGTRDAPSADTGVAADAGSELACSQDDACTWSDFDREIRSASDCGCLLCGSVVLNRSTFERRLAQYNRLCDPTRDGRGRPCPVADCFLPPPLLCNRGACARVSF